jgi:hypothetical protein
MDRVLISLKKKCTKNLFLLLKIKIWR